MVRDLHEIDIDDDDILIAFYDACYSQFAGLKIKKKTKHSKNSDDDDYVSSDMNDKHVPQFGKLIRRTPTPVLTEIENESGNPFYGQCVIESDSDENIDTHMQCDTNLEDNCIVDSSAMDVDSDDSKNEYNSNNMNQYDDTDDEFGYNIGGTVSETHEQYKQEILKNKVVRKWDKWGSGVEAYALSQTFHVPIIVYEAKRFNFKTNKIENGRLVNNTKPDKNVRFKITQIWGNEYQDTAPPIELLYKKVKPNVEHYMVLYRTNQQSTLDTMKFNAVV
jgi:hypothetical protein